MRKLAAIAAVGTWLLLPRPLWAVTVNGKVPRAPEVILPAGASTNGAGSPDFGADLTQNGIATGEQTAIPPALNGPRLEILPQGIDGIALEAQPPGNGGHSPLANPPPAGIVPRQAPAAAGSDGGDAVAPEPARTAGGQAQAMVAAPAANGSAPGFDGAAARLMPIVIEPGKPDFTLIFPPGLKGDDAVLHAAEGLADLAEWALDFPGARILPRLHSSPDDVPAWREAGFRPLSLGPSVAAFLKENPPGDGAIRIEDGRLAVSLSKPFPVNGGLSALSFELTDTRETRQAAERARRRDSASDWRFLLKETLARFAKGASSEPSLARVLGLPDASAKETLLELSGSAALRALLVSEEELADLNAAQARADAESERQEIARLRGIEGGKARERLEAATAAIVDGIRRRIAEGTAARGSPLRPGLAARVEDDLTALAALPARMLRDALQTAVPIAEISLRFQETLEREAEALRRRLEAMLAPKAGPSRPDAVASALRREAAAGWLTRVAEAVSGKEIADADQALLVYMFAPHVLEEMQSRIQDLRGLLRRGASREELRAALDGIEDSGLAAFPPGRPPRMVRRRARKSMDAVLERFDALGRELAQEQAGPRASDAAFVADALNAELALRESAHLRRAAFVYEFGRRLFDPAFVPEDLAEVALRSHAEDPDWTASWLTSMDVDMLAMFNYFTRWWGLKSRPTALNDKMKGLMELAPPELQRALEAEAHKFRDPGERRRVRQIEARLPEAVAEMERLVRSPSYTPRIVERIAELFRLLTLVEHAPQVQARVDAAMEHVETRVLRRDAKPAVSEAARRAAILLVGEAESLAAEAERAENASAALEIFARAQARAAAAADKAPEESRRASERIFAGAYAAAQRAHFQAERLPEGEAREQALGAAIGLYDSVYAFLDGTDYSDPVLVMQALSIMEMARANVVDIAHELERAAHPEPPPAPARPRPIEARFRLLFSRKAFAQVRARWNKDDAFRSKFPSTASELMLKGTKGDAKAHEWKGLWSDRLDHGSYRVYWRKDGSRIVFVGVFHKDETTKPHSPAVAFLADAAAADLAELRLVPLAESDAFLRGAVGLEFSGPE